jgi:outer membrane receptor protein involved in Fe transport
MAWSEYQLELVDPSSTPCTDGSGNDIPSTEPGGQIDGTCGQPWQRVVANAGDAHISGAMIELDYAPNDNWVLGMNAEFMEAETDTSQDLNGDGTNDLVKGLRLPIVPKLKGAGWVEYHWPVQWEGEKNAFIRTQWSYVGDTYNILEPLPTNEPNPQFKNDSYVIGDLRAGLQGDTWEVAVFVNNLTDERAQYTHQTGLFEWGSSSVAEGRAHISSIFTSRPREFGVSFSKGWGD